MYPGVSGRRLIHETIRRMINLMVLDLIEQTRTNIRAHGVITLDDVHAAPQLVAYSEGLFPRLRELKTFLRENLYHHYQVLRMTDKAKRIVGDLFDQAGNLVPQHHGFLDPDRAEAAVVVIVQVRSADAALAYAHPDLAGRDRLGDDGFDPQVFRGVDDECFHEQVSPGSALGEGRCRRARRRHKVAVTPPSTYRIWPLTNFEASLARNTAGPTRSSTSPQRRDGVRPISQLLNSGFLTSASLSSVLK